MVGLWGRGTVRIQQDPNAPHEAQYLYLNCEKAAQKLHWTPVLNLEKSLQWTADWYRAYYADPSSARCTTRRQIDDYMQLLGAA
jgi:CDP-glucose 4,6-dehydratase